ncbi:MAG: hypothetical protein KAG61_00850 [Bacteriovoracaceae bacterium]|nr:hypothetical protein [Bacteriovoracaceae bacterium]
MSVEIKVTKNYLCSLQEIEDFIWQTSGKDISVVEKFLDDHERMQIFVKENPFTPAPHPNTGDQSWPFGSGRYRVFFKVVEASSKTIIYFLDLIDNRMLNKAVYPNNSMPTYSVDD